MKSPGPPNRGEIRSRLVFGTGRLFDGDLANLEATIRRAYDLGIRHFDSSVGYDNAAPHAALARLIRDVPQDDLFISTKIGHIREDFPNYRGVYRNRDALWGIVHECFRMLRGKIDLLQVHEADLRFWWDDDAPDDRHCFLQPDASYQFDEAPVYHVVQDARERGICRSIGITGNSSGPLSRVARALDVDTIMCAYNLDPIFRGAERWVVPVAQERGLVMLAAGILQSGAYTRPDALPVFLARSDRVSTAIRKFGSIQRESGIPSVELVCRWAVSAVGVDKWVVGASTPEQIEQTIGYFERGALPGDVRNALDALAVEGLDWCDLWRNE